MNKKSIQQHQGQSEQEGSNIPYDECQIDEKTRGTVDDFEFKNKYYLYEKAINGLEEYSYPTSIPCRKNEKEEINRFLRNGVENKGCSSTLFISGFPGVGKTICVKDTIQLFKVRCKNYPFVDIHINAMNLIKPNYIYGAILKQLTNLDISGCKVLPILNQILTKGSFPTSLYNKNLTPSQLKHIEKRLLKAKILCIDQIDYLFTKNEDVLYNLFEWTQSPNSKIVLITISNTFTFPEKLEQKIVSRIGNERLIFKTYTSSEIEQILNQRMKQLKIFEEDAVRLIAKKLSNTSDIRKCLFILRESVSKFIEMKKMGETEDTLISMDIVLKKIKQLYDNPLVNSLRFLPQIQKTVLLRVIEVIKETGLQCWISELFVQIRLKKDKDPLTRSTVVEEALVRLKQLNIVKLSIQNRHKDNRVINDKVIPLHVTEFRIELNIDIVSLLKGLDVL